MKKLKKGMQVDYIGYRYEVVEVTDLSVKMRRVGSVSQEPMVTVAIGSDRFKSIFSDGIEIYKELGTSEKLTEVKVFAKHEPVRKYDGFSEIVDSLESDSKAFSSKTEATVWVYEALFDEGVERHYQTPLYMVLALYYYRTELLDVSISDIENYFNKETKVSKRTDFFKVVETVLRGGYTVLDIMKLVPTQYEQVTLKCLTGKIKLGVCLTDIKTIIKKYERERNMGNFKKMGDESLLELNAAVTAEMEERGLTADEQDEDGVNLAEMLEESGMDVKEVLALVKEAGATIKFSAKIGKMDNEELAALIEETLDEEQMEALIESLSGDEDADEDGEDEDGDDEDGDDEDGDDEDGDDASFADMLEAAMGSSDILDILEDAGVEIKLSAKQKKFDAEAMAEYLEETLDEDSMEALMEHLQSLEDEDADDEGDEDGDDAINVDDLDDDEVVEMAEEFDIKIPKVINKVTIKKLRAELQKAIDEA